MFQKAKLRLLQTSSLAATVLLAISGATAQQAGTAAQQRDLVLEGGTLIDGTGKAPITDAVIVVEGNRIKAVGKKGQVQIPANANVIDVTGRTILPGFIDYHMHSRDWQYPMFLPYGVTTIVDANSDPTWIFAQRDMLKSGKINGPRMLVSGGGLDGTMMGRVVGQWNTPIAKTPEDMRNLALNNAASGTDDIKILQDITDDQLKAALQVAKEKHLPALGHSYNLRRTAELGYKVGEHTWAIACGLVDPEDKHPCYNASAEPGQPSLESQVDPKTFPALVALLVKQGVYLCPHLVNTWRGATPRGDEFIADAKEILKDPGLAFVPDDVRAAWLRPLKPPGGAGGWDKMKEFLRQFAAAGGKVVTGTDTSAHGIPGLYLDYEMQMDVDVGFTPMQAIQAATLWGAQLIQKDKDLGSIEPGKLADIIAIEGDPLADISAVKHVRMVIKDGKVMDTKYDPHWVNPIPEPLSIEEAPTPQITALSPAVLRQGGSTVTLQVDGEKFTPDAIVHLNDKDLPTTFVSHSKLTAKVDAQSLPKTPGAYLVYVVMPNARGTTTTGAYEAVATANGAPPPLPPMVNMDGPHRFFSRSLHQINGLMPRQAPEDGKTVTLALNGLEFAPNSIVRFGDADLPTKFVSKTKLTATLDAKLLHKSPGGYVLYVVSPGPKGFISEPAFFMVGLKQ